MVSEVVVAAFEAQVEHEGRAGELLLGQLAIGPAPPEAVRDEPLHGPREVRVHDHSVGTVGALRGADADCPPALEEDLLDGLSVVELDPHLLAHRRHVLADGCAAPLGVPHAVLVFEEGEDREQARAAEGRHAEVLRLKAEGQADARVLEVALQLLINGAERPSPGRRGEGLLGEQVPPAVEGALEHRAEGLELASVVGHVALELRGVALGETRDLSAHPRDVWGAAELAARAIDQVVLGIEAGHGDLCPQITPYARVDLLEHLRVEEEGGSEIEAEALLGEARGAAPRATEALQNVHVQSGLAEQHG